MNPIFTTAAAAVVAVATFSGILLWARIYASDLKVASSFLDDHYRSAQKLIRDKETPASVLHFIEWFSRRAGDPALARWLALDALRGRLGRPAAEVEATQFARDIEALRPDMADAFAEMVAKGMLASAAADPAFSRLYRNALWLLLSRSGRPGDESTIERASTVALDITRGRTDCALAIAC